MSDNEFGQLGRLSNAETLVIQRRRLSESQAAAAKRYRVSYTVYSKWERGLVEGPRQPVRKLENHERCFLYRRRSNSTQAAAAMDLRCCRYWVNLQERGEQPCDKLLAYWET